VGDAVMQNLRRPSFRVVESNPDAEISRNPLGLWMILAVLLAVPVAIGFLWVLTWLIQGLGIVVLIWSAVLS
jgi:uncharacterized membrane protein